MDRGYAERLDAAFNELFDETYERLLIEANNTQQGTPPPSQPPKTNPPPGKPGQPPPANPKRT